MCLHAHTGCLIECLSELSIRVTADAWLFAEHHSAPQGKSDESISCPKPGLMGCAWNASSMSHPTLGPENHSPGTLELLGWVPGAGERFSQ